MVIKRRSIGALLFLLYAVTCSCRLSAQSSLSDTLFRLPEVVVQETIRRQEVIRGQVLEGPSLQRMSTFSIADAVRFFSGVQIKDYGGIGGLKTINIRGMGSQHVGIFYDGIEVGNAQNGQVDLGKFSMDNIASISLYNGQRSMIFQPAKDFGSAGSVYIKTRKPSFIDGKESNLRLTARGGSFGYLSSSILWERKLPRHYAIGANAEVVRSRGNYPFKYRRLFQDGVTAYDTTAYRENSDITAYRVEASLYKTLENGAWDIHGYYYQSHRGLPGPIIRNVFKHGQRLTDENAFVQSKYSMDFSDLYALKLNVKYANDYTRYVDDEWTSPTYVDNEYLQHEVYLSAANLLRIRPWWHISLSTDYQYNMMKANLVNFSEPTRHTALIALATQLRWGSLLTLQLSGLETIVRETVKRNAAAPPKDIFTPSVFLSFKPWEEHDLTIDAFYKRIFRMPTFNDLYYTFIGNAALRPEYTRQLSLGVHYDLERSEGWLRKVDLKAEAYLNHVTDKIIAVPAGNMFRWMMLNLGQVDVTGLELNASLGTMLLPDFALSCRAGYTYQSAIDVTSSEDKNYRHQIIYIPRHSGSFTTMMDYKSWGVNYSFIYTGIRYNAKYNDVNSRMLPWYTSDLSFRKTFTGFGGKGLIRTSVDINNIFDQHYDVVLNYPMPGRNYKLTIALIL